MTSDKALAPLRARGTRIILAFIWANVLAVLPIGLFLGARDSWLMVFCLLAAAALPSWCAYKRREDSQSRAITAITLTILPIVYVSLFRGDPWQMDSHMYFFVCFSLTVLLCDRAAVLIVLGLTVVHHLLFFLLMPDWVFPGSGSIARVLFHGFLVGCQALILFKAIQEITSLKIETGRAREEADQARQQADIARHQAEDALERSRLSEQRAEREHRERLVAEAALKVASDNRRLTTAEEIDQSVGALLTDLRRVAEEFAQQAGDINSVSAILADEAGHLRTSSEDAVDSIFDMARNTEELADSIRIVGSNAHVAQQVAMTTARSIATLGPGIQKLGDEVDTANSILQLVSEIASQSNLLALNASIEAARSGDAGRGFAVVAAEMKQMALATSRAADEISGKLAGIVTAANAFRAQIDATTERVDEITESSSAIAVAVEQQQVATEAIARGAELVLSKASTANQRSSALHEAAGRNRAIADSTIQLANQLGARARDLSDRMEGLLAQLRAA